MDVAIWFPSRPEHRAGTTLACSQRFGWLSLLALDWRKTFDSINSEVFLSLCVALDPHQLLEVIRSIYTNRIFEVRDGGVTSSRCGQQSSGVCQGCPLSPFLFGILMTVLMHDAYMSLGRNAQDAYLQGRLHDVLSADDTLLLGTCSTYVGELAHAVEGAGARYGMNLHWGKPNWLIFVLVEYC